MRILKISDFTNESNEQKMTFMEAAQYILKKNGNKPMTSTEIWNLSQDLVHTSGKTPQNSMNAQMICHSQNTNISGKKKRSLFRIVEGTKPYKFVLINPNLEVQSIPDEKQENVSVYCVRAGRSNRDFEKFFSGSFVGIGYETRGFDISQKTEKEIRDFLLVKYQDKKESIPQFLHQILLFCQIEVDDIILVPNSNTDKVSVGIVVSDVYLEEDDEYPNRIDVEWIGEVDKNPSLNLPKSVFRIDNFDTENFVFTDIKIKKLSRELAPSKPQSLPQNRRISPFGAQSQYNGFDYNTSSPCILAPSGRGKSTTILKLLNALSKVTDSKYEFIIPTASTTGLLSQYSPSQNSYVQSRLGKLIMEAHNNPNRLVTAVFDECHKSNVIEMINDELLQSISTKRNAGKRFISLDGDTSSLYSGLKPDNKGNLLIPDNFGFIFLSSKPDVIVKNSDFFNRVDVYVLLDTPVRELSINPDELLELDTEYFEKIEGKDENSIKEIYTLLSEVQGSEEE